MRHEEPHRPDLLRPQHVAFGGGVARASIVGAVTVIRYALARGLADVVVLTVVPKLQGALARARLKSMMSGAKNRNLLRNKRVVEEMWTSNNYTMNILRRIWLTMTA
jgi:dihydrofolate reductase